MSSDITVPLCFFEDRGDLQFAPLTITRPVDDLRIGIFTIREKWLKRLGTNRFARIQREPLTRVFPADNPADLREGLWINARWLPDEDAAAQAVSLSPGSYLLRNGKVVAARLQDDKHRKFALHPVASSLAGDGRSTNAGTWLAGLWDIFLNNGREIERDIDLLREPAIDPVSAFPRVVLVNADRIHAAESARIDPGVVIDASAGPVYLGPGSHVMYGAVLLGPVAICEKSTVKMGAKISNGTTAGPVCKLNGEVENVILQSYSNKGHDGFLGNSLIGEWCNLGANTITSNLKNNYKSVRIPEWPTGEEFDTRQQFFGAVMGDHGKTAINTSLSAGTLSGVCTNIFTTDFPPKHIPSFSWVSPEGIQKYRFEKAIETIETIMKRRQVNLTDDYRDMLHQVF
ncbi:putative sugar nucleotidyl transferase [Balneolales bacterium ANBcel1]|nr:putative sugar nucleotidyl transferase [Balneolales bacterium ANBcel1]